jgi:hypothetical protein
MEFDDHYVEANLYILLLTILTKDHLFAVVLVLTVVVSIMLYAFLGYHFYSIHLGMTTNERYKTSKMASRIEEKLKFF